MNKIAETRYPIHDLLARRWSPRAFADRPLEELVFAGVWDRPAPFLHGV